jgi:hypothetical protein
MTRTRGGQQSLAGSCRKPGRRFACTDGATAAQRAAWRWPTEVLR